MLGVDHQDNRGRSVEEAERDRGSRSQRLLDGGTFDRPRRRRPPLTLDDILIVAPYNAQVRCLRAASARRRAVGTVDKFQGQEAPVVFFSMATSTGEDVYRGLSFLFSRNRLNVAISRAQALAVVVCSPTCWRRAARRSRTCGWSTCCAGCGKMRRLTPRLPPD